MLESVFFVLFEVRSSTVTFITFPREKFSPSSGHRSPGRARAQALTPLVDRSGDSGPQPCPINGCAPATSSGSPLLSAIEVLSPIASFGPKIPLRGFTCSTPGS